MNSARYRRFVVALAMMLAASVGPGRTHAATFVVNDPGSSPDANPGDGTCLTPEGACTFNAALSEAGQFGGPDTIQLPAGTWQVITWIDDDVEIAGVGTGTIAATILDGGRNSSTIYTGSVLMMRDGVTLTLRGVAVQNGYSAVLAAGPLTIIDSIVRDHTQTGVWCSGVVPSSVTVIDSTFANNRGINAGGGIACDGPVKIIGSAFNQNFSVNVGGAMAVTSAEIYNSSFFNNRVGNAGGAVHADGPLTVQGCTFRVNNAGNVGGAIASNASADIRNSTFVNNSVINTGGGIHVDGGAAFNNVTIARNSAGNIGGGVSIGDNSTVSMANSILFANAGERCEVGFESGGYNFLPTICAGVATATDHVGVDPLIGVLANNGGPTLTAALADGSPAIDAGGDGCENVDQRGVPRPQGSACDAGAYEKISCDYDGITEAGEQCDDGNTTNGDGCSSLCQSELLAGRKLHLRNGTGGKLLAQVADARVGLGWGNFSADDPVIRGGKLRVMSTEGDGFDVTYDLPAAGWKYIGREGRNRGYTYKSDDGIVRAIKIQPGRLIKIKGIGPIDVPLGDDPNPVHVFLTIGARTYCGGWGGSVNFERNRFYRAKLAPPPAWAP